MTLATAVQRHCLFLTLTVPSSMHALRMGLYGRQTNPEYDGVSTPRDAQSFLTMEWECVCARLQSSGAQCWGARVVEPHFDGTPHWHVLMWVEGGQMSLADAIRVCKGDSSKGTISLMAAVAEGLGSINKYIAKCAAPDDRRVIDWAATWGFRLFQRFGVWPEGGAA